LGDTVRTSFPAPNGADAVIPSRGLGRISSRTDQRHRWSGQPSWTYFTLRRFGRRARSWLILGFATACFSLGSRELGSCSTSSRRRAPAPFRMPLPSVRGLSVSFRVFTGRPPPCFAAYSADLLGPSHGVSLPPADISAKDPDNPGIPTSPAVASSGFEPSRRLDPLHAFPTSLPRPLMGLLPSGLFSSRRSGSSFEDPYPLGFA
jgi:hypothetical protein